jgi:hypothetical protein
LWSKNGREGKVSQAASRNGNSIALCGALQATPWHGYPQRTEWNVRDSDGTLVLTAGEADRGTALTIELAKRYKKPCLVLDLDDRPDPATVGTWAERHGVRELNVAGPRESSRPRIHAAAVTFLREVLF